MKKTNGKLVFGIIAGVALLSLIISGKAADNKTVKASFKVNNQEVDFDSNSLERFSKLFGKKGRDFEESVKITSSAYFSVIHINGVISEENRTYNQKWLLKQIKKATDDYRNKGIILFISSPGGTVYESDEAYLALLDYKENTGRPVYAYFGSLAASGGYYIGCAADKIYANRNCLTGSIGVIAGQTVDATGLMEKIGIKSTTITAGRNKNMGNYNAALTEEQKAIMQSIADEAYAQFTGIVAESRNMNIKDVQKLADGRIYTANQAKKNGLIDDVCTVAELKEIIQEDMGEDTKVEFVDCKYKYEESLFNMLYGAASFVENPAASIYSMLGETSGKCFYLYQ